MQTDCCFDHRLSDLVCGLWVFCIPRISLNVAVALLRLDF
jgi:hypothetical protein